MPAAACSATQSAMPQRFRPLLASRTAPCDGVRSLGSRDDGVARPASSAASTRVCSPGAWPGSPSRGAWCRSARRSTHLVPSPASTASSPAITASASAPTPVDSATGSGSGTAGAVSSASPSGAVTVTPFPGARRPTEATRWPGSSAETAHESVEPEDPVVQVSRARVAGASTCTSTSSIGTSHSVPTASQAIRPFLRDVVEGVPEHVAVQPGDCLVGIPDPQQGDLAREVCPAEEVRGSGRTDVHRFRGPQVGDVAEDPVAVGRGAEVVVDHLDDLGAAVLEDRRGDPQLGHALPRSTRWPWRTPRPR